MPNVPSYSINEATCVPVKPVPEEKKPIVDTVKPEPVIEEQEPIGPKKTVTLDLANLNRTIGIYAEMKAIEEFDENMRNSRGLKGFFSRSFHRLGRSAWIDSRKREVIREVESGLSRGTYTAEFLSRYVTGATAGIDNQAYLEHEKAPEITAVPAEISKLVRDAIAQPVGSSARKSAVFALKAQMESQYKDFTLSPDQLESAVAKIQLALVQSEVKNFDLKLQMFDIGRIESEKIDKQDSWIVKMLDKIDTKITSTRSERAPSKLENFMREKVLGVIRHPTTAALAAAFSVSGLRMLFAGAATGVTGGLVAPLIAGSLVGGGAAGVRGKREMRDRNAQIGRRGALGYETNTEYADGKSHDIDVHNTKHNQSSVKATFDALDAFSKKDALTDMEKSEAREIALCYLIRHKLGRTTDMNLLRYEDNWFTGSERPGNRHLSVSEQHVAVVVQIKKLMGPDFIKLVDGLDLMEPKTPEEKELHSEYTTIRNLIANAIAVHKEKLKKNELNYAIKQGAIFATVAGVVGTVAHAAIDALTHLDFFGTKTPVADNCVPGKTVVPRPPLERGDTIQVHGRTWLDNGTPKTFDHTELMTWNSKTGGLNVARMIGQTATSSHGQSLAINSGMFADKSIQALLSTDNGSVLIPIDAKGELLIPDDLKADIVAKRFNYLEIVRAHMTDAHTVKPDVISTVEGDGTMVLPKIPQPDDVITTECKPVIVERQTNGGHWWLVPVGATPYHELGPKNPPKGFAGRLPKDPNAPTICPKWPNTDQEGAEAPVPGPNTPPNQDSAEQRVPKSPKEDADAIALPIPNEDEKEKSNSGYISQEELELFTPKDIQPFIIRQITGNDVRDAAKVMKRYKNYQPQFISEDGYIWSIRSVTGEKGKETIEIGLLGQPSIQRRATMSELVKGINANVKKWKAVLKEEKSKTSGKGAVKTPNTINVNVNVNNVNGRATTNGTATGEVVKNVAEVTDQVTREQAEKAYLGLIKKKYLTLPGQQETEEEMNKYAESLTEVIGNFGEAALEATKKDIRNTFDAISAKTPLSSIATQDAWIYREIAKQYFLSKNPEIAKKTPEGAVANPLDTAAAGIRSRKMIAQRYLGWEFVQLVKAKYPDQNSNLREVIADITNLPTDTLVKDTEAQKTLDWIEHWFNTGYRYSPTGIPSSDILTKIGEQLEKVANMPSMPVMPSVWKDQPKAVVLDWTKPLPATPAVAANSNAQESERHIPRMTPFQAPAQRVRAG